MTTQANGKYYQLRLAGCKALEVYRTAKADGLHRYEAFRIVREVFGLSILESKEVMIVGENWAASLTEHEERLVQVLQDVLSNDENERE